MIFKFLTTSPQQTRKAGKILAEEFLRSQPGKKAPVVGLIGDLGGGKTTFLQGFAKGLSIGQKITSPTFVIMKRFPFNKRASNNFYHIDCYRLKRTKELQRLGFREIAAQPQNIVAVEWADKVKSIMPKNSIWVSFEFVDKTTRKIVIK